MMCRTCKYCNPDGTCQFGYGWCDLTDEEKDKLHRMSEEYFTGNNNLSVALFRGAKSKAVLQTEEEKLNHFEDELSDYLNSLEMAGRLRK
jgi:GTP-binding protein EngB required for normal cell division